MKHLFVLPVSICLMTIGCTNTPNTASDKDSSGMTNATAGVSTPNAMLEKNRTTAIASIQGFINHDANATLKDVAPDFVDYSDGSSPPIKGLDSCKAMINSMLTAFPDFNGTNLMTLAEGDHVAVFGDWSGTFKGNMKNMPPTGKSFKIKDVDLFTFNNNGQITEHRSVQSMEAMMMQVMPDKKK